MQQALLILILILFGLYFILLFYYRLGWKAIPGYKCPEKSNPRTRITLIIPARNEAEHIGACLESINKQSYPKELFEILVVDDHSTDDTAVVVKKYASPNTRLINLKDFVKGGELNSYKKKAIEVAIAQSSGELIVTTDADCIVKPDWLLTIASFYEQQQAQFIAVPVVINCGNRFIEIFQALDFMTLQGITGASVYKKMHSMCNGANLAYTKKAFEAVHGFAGIDSIASGDDMLLMHKIYRQYPDKVMFLKSKDVIVQTTPVKTISAFFDQRIRWASKAGKYDDKRIIAVLLLVYLVNVLLIALPVTGLILTEKYSIFNIPFSIIDLWLTLLLSKTFVELIFLYPVSNFFGKRSLLWLFPFLQPFHIFYTLIAGWLGTYGSYSWKERRVK